MNEGFIKRSCFGCRHSLVQLAPDGSIRSAGCGHARDTAPDSVRKTLRMQDALRIGSCPLEEAKAA